MRLVYTIFSVLCFTGAALVYGFGPFVDTPDAEIHARSVAIFSGGLLVLCVFFIVLGCKPKRGFRLGGAAAKAPPAPAAVPAAQLLLDPPLGVVDPIFDDQPDEEPDTAGTITPGLGMEEAIMGGGSQR